MKSLFKNKNICVVGLGKTGLSCVDFLQKQQANIFAMDTRKTFTLPQNFPTNVAVEIGRLNEEWLLKSDLIVLSPGLSLKTPEIQRAISAGKKVVGDIEIFCQLAKKPILAITGSNGKSTVTTLVTEMGKAAGLNVGMGGNIGIPALSLLDKNCDLYVLELSSFQLETTHSLSAQGATVLNISEDHLNRYKDLEDYRQAKLKIYQRCRYAITNGEDPLTKWEPYIQDAPIFDKVFAENGGDYWIKTENDRRYLMARDEEILACDQMGIKGRHNEMNALAAIALAESANIPRDAIRQALREFTGLSHRFQCVHDKDGVQWINDSKATNIGSTVAALAGLPPLKGNLHLLLGGDGKGANFDELTPYLNKPNIYTYCFGQDGQALAALSEQSTHVSTMKEAIACIKNKIKSGDMVLLSPACASLDQFRSFEERGDVFTALAKE